MGFCLVLVTALSSTHSPIYSLLNSLEAAFAIHSEQGPALVIKVPGSSLSGPPHAQTIDTQPFPPEHVHTLIHIYAYTYTRVQRDTVCRHICTHRHTGTHTYTCVHTYKGTLAHTYLQA